MTDTVHSETVKWRKGTMLFNGKKCTTKTVLDAAYCAVGDKYFISGGCCKSGDSEEYSESSWLVQKGRKEGELRCEMIPNPPKEFRPRSQHSATLIGECVWLIGGRGSNQIFSDIFTYNIHSREWKQQSLRNSRPISVAGHEAIVYPDDNEKILIYGGYTNTHDNNTLMPQLILLDTKTLKALPIHSNITRGNCRTGGTLAYTGGSKLYALGGCNCARKGVKGGASYDTINSEWVHEYIKCRALDGLVGARAVTYQDRIYVFGGRSKGKSGQSLSGIIEITLGNDPGNTRSNFIDNCNISGRCHHILLRFGDELYTFFGNGKNEGENGTVYFTDLKHLSKRLRERESSIVHLTSHSTDQKQNKRHPFGHEQSGKTLQIKDIKPQLSVSNDQLCVSLCLSNIIVERTQLYKDLQAEKAELQNKLIVCEKANRMKESEIEKKNKENAALRKKNKGYENIESTLFKAWSQMKETREAESCKTTPCPKRRRF